MVRKILVTTTGFLRKDLMLFHSGEYIAQAVMVIMKVHNIHIV